MKRSTLANARWPVNRVVRELACGASVFAQHKTNKVGEIKVIQAMELGKLLRKAHEIKNQGGDRLCVQKLNLEEIVGLTNFHASFAQEVRLTSQCGMITVLTDRQVTNRLVIGHLVEIVNSAIQRVVSSTMSKSLDRQI